jgi:hypothetical protein
MYVFMAKCWVELIPNFHFRSLEEVMSGIHKNENEVRVELKYCERCGGLWVRERGTGDVYCGKCQGKVAELPIPKKKPGRIILPVGTPTVVKAEADDFETAGGVA